MVVYNTMIFPLPSGKRLQKTNWKDPHVLMGKLTVSTGPFSIATVCQITRGHPMESHS